MMSKPLFIMRKDVSVGIYNNCKYIARVYGDKIIIRSPYIKWVGNTGGYAEAKNVIREPNIIGRITRDLSDNCEESAWGKIGNALGDTYLSYSGCAY